MDPFTLKEIAETATESGADVPQFDTKDKPETQENSSLEDLGNDIPDFSQKNTDSPNKNDGLLNEEIEELKEKYIDDIIDNSEVPETIDKDEALKADYTKCSVEETAEKREEFDRTKNSLIEEWEKKNGQKWPTYSQDVYSNNGRLIRHAGDKYDAHHIQPLSMGGKNVASNLTPMHAECHYDRQGVHAPDSAYAKLEQKLGA